MPIELRVPEIGESITEVTVGKWHKGVGEHVEKDEGVVELESDKATVDLPAPSAGTISKMLKQSGQTAAVGEVIGLLAAVDDTVPVQGATKPEEPADTPQPQRAVVVEKKGGRTAIGPVQPADASTATAEKERPQPPPSRSDGNPPFVMPAAERLLAEHGLSAGDVRATGPGGRLLKEDVERHIAAAGEAAKPQAAPAARPPASERQASSRPPTSAPSLIARQQPQFPLAPRSAGAALAKKNSCR